jgi:hypothetical protein
VDPFIESLSRILHNNLKEPTLVEFKRRPSFQEAVLIEKSRSGAVSSERVPRATDSEYANF